jgi:TatD family-associated radical SAM protein
MILLQKNLEDVERQLGALTTSVLLYTGDCFCIYSITAGADRYLLKVYQAATEDSLLAEIRKFTFLNSYLPEFFPTVTFFSSEGAYLAFLDSKNTELCLSEIITANNFTGDIAEALGQALAMVHNKIYTISAPFPVQLNSLSSLSKGIPVDTPLAEAVSKLMENEPTARAIPVLGAWSPGSLLLSGHTPTTFLDLSGLCNGNPTFDVGLLLGDLLINAKRSVQKGRLFYSRFLKGYHANTTRSLNSDEVRTAVLWGIHSILSTNLLSTHSMITPDEKDMLLNNVLTASYDTPRNIQTFINVVLGTGEVNFGRLDGRIVADKQIIYHKRGGSEFSINITNRCPNSCIFCIRDFAPGWHLKESGGQEVNLYLEHEPSEEEIREAIKVELSNWDTPPKLIKFCGYGEPVLRFDIVLNIARFLHQQCPEAIVQLNTSGWPLLKYHGVEAISSLYDAGVNKFSISLNAPDQETYDRIVRPGSYKYEKMAFDLTIECLKAVAALGIPVKATIVAVPLIKDRENDSKYLAETCNAEFAPREFIGKELPGLSMDGNEVVEKESKILNVKRDELIIQLRELGATYRLGGLTRLHHYDIPVSDKKRQHILRLIEKNPPEFRRFFSLLSVIAECIRDGSTLYSRGGLLRLRCEPNGEVVLIYKELEKVSDYVKKEKEYAYTVENEEKGIAIIKHWGLELFRYIEKNREAYTLDGIIFDIDTWPQLGTYLEIEAEDEMAIFQGMAKLGIPTKLACGLHAESLFEEQGIDLTRLLFTTEELRRLGISRDPA